MPMPYDYIPERAWDDLGPDPDPTPEQLAEHYVSATGCAWDDPDAPNPNNRPGLHNNHKRHHDHAHG